ncbi:spermidine synthase [Wenjunlia vitaminophila]|uniref:Polyamine aminopropyltransferase n=1 Tax=Wenjunlia vitaminophila TaxID=76728 RepID=A0A0T6LPS2_WENVI|nr:spermidine synthase [Wenjunlia vitaminophila]
MRSGAQPGPRSGAPFGPRFEPPQSPPEPVPEPPPEPVPEHQSGPRPGGELRPQPAPRLPVSVRRARQLVLLGVFTCAACGLVYELALVALASYLVGDSVTQASVVLSVMVFAMGVGSLLAKRWCGRAAAAFGVVEALLALVGGLSTFALYGCFAWCGQARVALVGFSFAIGVLVGGEIPLLMVLISRIRRQAPGADVADLFAADYVGALVGGLAFPFLLLPLLGQLEAVLLAGMVNAVSGCVMVLWLFRADLTRRQRSWLYAANAAALSVLAVVVVCAGSFEQAAREAIYGQEIRRSVHTGVREIVLAGDRPQSLRLFVDGRLRLSGADGRRYHEGLVHPAMAGPHRRVLVLGGGDGLALREVLRYPGVREVTVVDVDPALIELADGDPVLSALNEHAFDDPRVRADSSDVFQWLRGESGTSRYDVVLSDLPDPGESRSSKLYSQEFYGLLGRALAPGGRLAVHAGSSVEHPRTFWTVASTVRSANLRTAEYRVGAGAGQDWGFVLASRHRPELRLWPVGGLRDSRSLRAGSLSRDRPRHLPPPSTLMHPRYLDATTP